MVDHFEEFKRHTEQVIRAHQLVLASPVSDQGYVEAFRRVLAKLRETARSDAAATAGTWGTAG